MKLFGILTAGGEDCDNQMSLDVFFSWTGTKHKSTEILKSPLSNFGEMEIDIPHILEINFH